MQFHVELRPEAQYTRVSAHKSLKSMKALISSNPNAHLSFCIFQILTLSYSENRKKGTQERFYQSVPEKITKVLNL
jgi:hypothetical protein